MSGETTTTTATETQATTTATADNVLGNAAVTAAEQTATETKATAGTEAETSKAATGDKAGTESKDTKAADADKPIEYQDFKLPEGVEVDAATLGEAKTLFAGMKLPQEQAQQLVDFYTGKINSFSEAQAKAWGDLQEKWKGEVKADKDIGGDRFDESISAAGKAMDRFGPPGLRQAMMVTGAGNHPDIVRFVVNVGKAISEDKLVLAGGPAAAEKSAAETLYPNQSKAG
ncbi:MAG: peptidase [Alphaproteobacteria bacterium]|nr:peptidase [Alphaproteobacteria bacterium]MCW5739664.1 peptidase [Alphaproteobacteria bacterium]